ncbi:hypothetical protein RFM99_29190 [Mesorhizobium sp. VK4C]|uniref:hypothetical protein n=1 Tax=Mesorhizobium captivum TaxID=3072319 RepID=UPI002A245D98|nr:hypothetical protein [Mesorhizobium sp. VK4C]MDX8502462.1 hypothetical protein [Mesorhizobium sp. VK4C]
MRLRTANFTNWVTPSTISSIFSILLGKNFNPCIGHESWAILSSAAYFRDLGAPLRVMLAADFFPPSNQAMFGVTHVVKDDPSRIVIDLSASKKNLGIAPQPQSGGKVHSIPNWARFL